jgi:hypothetical protein
MFHRQLRHDGVLFVFTQRFFAHLFPPWGGPEVSRPSGRRFARGPRMLHNRAAPRRERRVGAGHPTGPDHPVGKHKGAIPTAPGTDEANQALLGRVHTRPIDEA